MDTGPFYSRILIKLFSASASCFGGCEEARRQTREVEHAPISSVTPQKPAPFYEGPLCVLVLEVLLLWSHDRARCEAD